MIDVPAVFQQHHRGLALDRMPAVLLPRKSGFGLVDHEKMFCTDPAEDDVVDIRGVDRETGCTALVRTDHYGAHVLPLDGHDEPTVVLSGVLLPAR